jgi:hypothetical protein
MNPWHGILPERERTLDVHAGNKLIAKDIEPSDARLIAAAPELLSAARFAREALAIAYDGDHDALTELDAAIAKAEGKP